MPATLSDIQRKYGESIYPLYKDQMHEPYMENDRGIGYKGIILTRKLDKKIQCNECGNWYKSLSAHLFHKHKISSDEYKDKNNLGRKVPLCSEEYSATKRKEANRRKLVNGIGGKKGMKWSKETLRKRAIGVKRGKNTMWFKNKYGLCPAQMATRMMIVRDVVGKTSLDKLTTVEVRKIDRKLYSAIKEKYGTIKKASDKLGLKMYREHKFEDATLIAKLRSFVIKNERLPISSDTRKTSKELPTYMTFCNHFGSWNRAKMMAGLDQLLAEVKNK